MNDQMRIAIFGATSQLARDLAESLYPRNDVHFTFFGRRPDAVKQWLESKNLVGKHSICSFDGFSNHDDYDALINFVGAGNPEKIKLMGSSIIDITHRFDRMALDYIKQHEDCKYIYMSSGAAYGSSFPSPVDQRTMAQFPLGDLRTNDWYGISKFHTESLHRAESDFAIVDLRIFSYFSRNQNPEAKFLMSDILKSILQDSTLDVSPDFVIRDFLNPDDFCQMVERVLSTPKQNLALDCYSRAPIEKMELLGFMREKFGLRFQVNGASKPRTDKIKSYYYSINHEAQKIGYSPKFSSLEGIEKEMSHLLG